MLEQDVTYSIESEIDKAFPYLDKLDMELTQLKDNIEKEKLLNKSPMEEQNKRISFLKLFLSRKPEKKAVKVIDKPAKLRKKTLKYQNYSKDGYIFRIQLIQKYDDISIKYYEFSVNITFDNLVKKEQFYKRFDDVNEAKLHYSNMDGVFKHLKRRDLMERLFNEKQQEINHYKTILS